MNTHVNSVYMNIFCLSESYDPIESAMMQCDAHIRKMGIETCQLLSIGFTLDQLSHSDCPRTQTGNPRKHFNVAHPCCKWAIETRGNFNWLIEHSSELFRQFNYRYNKTHFTSNFLDWVKKNSYLAEVNSESLELTDFPVTISNDKNCRNHLEFDNVPTWFKYRLYYNYDKPFASWNRGVSAPTWFENMEQ